MTFRRKASAAMKTGAWVALLALAAPLPAQQQPPLTRADTLRGTITPERAWWDVVYYDLALRVNPAEQSISGSTLISFAATSGGREMQIDLAAALQVDSITQRGRRLEHRRDGDAVFVRGVSTDAGGRAGALTVHFRGKPRVAPNAPWDGGFVWARDARGNPWVATAVQGNGASLFWPNKDHQSDEPDSMRIRVTVPSSMVDVSNGRLEDTQRNADGTTTYTWRVTNPINNYNVTINAGSYVHFADRFDGESGALDLDYWVLEPNLEAARKQFEQVKPMLRCFESWFGPYPFYEDGFKIVETPHLGMEHQSAIAYGNRFMNGYRGQDLSRTGLGNSWDYIIVHEAAHEWWGNNITTDDIADMWVHEGFGQYAEGLYVECLQNKEAGARYLIGLRQSIDNREPVTGVYGVNREGSGDMYPKGANMLHTIRQVVDDDALWKSILRGLNETFRHQTVTADEVEAYISRRKGRDLSKVFEQYLDYPELPVLEYSIENGTLRYRWRASVDGFDLPVRVTLRAGRTDWISPVSYEWRTQPVQVSTDDFEVDENFYVVVQRVAPGR
jgi:aminopeptidase N